LTRRTAAETRALTFSVAAAAVGLDRVIDHLGAEPLEQLVHLHRVFGVVDAVQRPHPLAAVVRRHAEPGERADHLVADGGLADVGVDHVEQVPHG